MRLRLSALVLLVVAAIGLTAAAGGTAVHKKKPAKLTAAQKLSKITHFVVIYEENHSFDNLYGGWEGVNGLANAGLGKTQVDQTGKPYTCLLQKDVNLTSPPLPASCTDTTQASSFQSAFPNGSPFTIDTYIKPEDKTCPPILKAFSYPNGVAKDDPNGLPGGCTRDMVHKFFQEIYQLDNGKQDRYMTGSDAAGLVLGTYDTKALAIYKYLHSAGHPKYVILDNFFEAAFGGSYLNHQWLIAAATPTYPGAPDTLHSILDANGFPNASYPLYKPTGPVRDAALTPVCPAPLPTLPCGDYSVNTQQPSNLPSGAFGAKLPLQTQPTIGDRLSAKKIHWGWYAGGWSNANGDTTQPGWTNGTGPSCSDPNADPNVSKYPHCPSNLFQFHHQPFNYYKAFDYSTPEGQANRNSHLKDEQQFVDYLNRSTSACKLNPVSFIKPFGTENEHPGYASTPNGDDHLVALVKLIEKSACAKNTMVIVTYDEFGGQWDHVPPPGQLGSTIPGPHDQFGPGTRIPALVIAPGLTNSFGVDSKEHDTTSILATLEHRYKLDPLGTRDAQVNDLATVFSARKVG